MQIGGKTFYRLSEVQEATGESRHLINFLIRDRQIPYTLVGMSKLLDEKALRLLRDAVAEYRSKPEPASATA